MIDLDYDDDFEDVQMVQSMSYGTNATTSPAAASGRADVGSESALIEELEEVDGPAAARHSHGAVEHEGFVIPAFNKAKGGRRALPGGPRSESESPSRLRVGTPGVAMSSRSNSTLPGGGHSTEATGMNSDIEEERDDVDHTINFRGSHASGGGGGGASSKPSVGFRVKTFQEIRGNASRQYDGSCVLLGAGLDGGGHVYAVHRFPIASDEVNNDRESGVFAQHQLAPTLVRMMRTRLQALTKVPAHPHVLRCYGATIKEGALFCPADFAAGGSLVDLIDAEKAKGTALRQLPEELARLVFHHVLRGVRHLHAHGFAHGAIHMRNVYVHESVSSPGAALSGADADGLLVDDDDDANAAAGLVAALGGFSDAVMAGSAPSAAASTAVSAAGSPKAGPTMPFGGGGGGSSAWGIAEPIHVSGSPSPQETETFSPLPRRSRNAKTSTPQSVAREVSIDWSVGGGSQQDEQGGSPQTCKSSENFAADLQGLSKLFTALFRGFTAAGDPCDVVGAVEGDGDGGEMEELDLDIEEIDASPSANAAAKASPVHTLSSDAADFERAMRRAFANPAAMLRRHRGQQRGDVGGPRSSASSGCASLELLDQVLADPFMNAEGIAAAVTASCRKAAAKSRAFRSRASHAGAAPLAMGLVQHARRRRRDAVMACVKQRATDAQQAGGGNHKSFRFAPVAGGPPQRRSRSPAHAGRRAGNPLEPVEVSTMASVAAPSRIGLQPVLTARKRDVSPLAPPAPSTGRGPVNLGVRRTMAVL